MSKPAIHVFNHHAMATLFQVRIADEDKTYAGQVADALFAVTDQLENLLSRFRQNSEISQIATLMPGETLRLSEPVFSCLQIARQMEQATGGAFSISAATSLQNGGLSAWDLQSRPLSIRCHSGPLKFDLGAIGKGFALDRMAEAIVDWGCPAHLLVAGGSSILAGAPPSGLPGWSSGLGEDNSKHRYWLENCSLSGSGIAEQGRHIIDPRTGIPAQQRERAWAFAAQAAVSDALSTACMVLAPAEIAALMERQEDWLVMLNDGGQWQPYGRRQPPLKAPA